MSRRKGSHYEQLAEQFLQKKGLKSVESNYSCRGGELDLIMRDGETLCFVEVKYRKNNAFGGTAYSVSAAKQNKIVRCALHYIARNPRYQQAAYRFDVVFIQAGNWDSAEEFNWIKAAFETEGY